MAQSRLTRHCWHDEAAAITQYFPYSRTDSPPRTCPAHTAAHISCPASRGSRGRTRPGRSSGRSSHTSRRCYSRGRRCRQDRGGDSGHQSSRAGRYILLSRGDTWDHPHNYLGHKERRKIQHFLPFISKHSSTHQTDYFVLLNVLLKLSGLFQSFD